MVSKLVSDVLFNELVELGELCFINEMGTSCETLITKTKEKGATNSREDWDSKIAQLMALSNINKVEVMHMDDSRISKEASKMWFYSFVLS